MTTADKRETMRAAVELAAPYMAALEGIQMTYGLNFKESLRLWEHILRHQAFMKSEAERRSLLDMIANDVDTRPDEPWKNGG